MEAEIEQAVNEIKRLKGCINNLISVQALPAIWSGGQPSQIVSALLDMLLEMLSLDFVYARLKDSTGGASLEMARLAQDRNLTAQPQMVGRALNPWLGDFPHVSPSLVRNPIGDGDVSVLLLRLGLQAEMGVFVAGSKRADFPTQTERLLLNVAANQAAIGLQEARLLREQKRLAEELDQRVAQRTSQLLAANEELEKEIAERERAEQKLGRSEAYLAEAQRLTHTGSWVQNVATGERTHSSEEFCRLYGFDPERGVPSDQEFRQRIHRDDVDRVVEVYERAVRERTDFEMDYRIILPDGAVKYLHAIGHPVFNAAGDLVEYIGINLDVTERRQAEETLRRSEAYLAEAQRLTHTASWARKVATEEITHSSEEHSRLYGFDPEEGVPSFEALYQRVHPEDRARGFETYDRAVGERTDFEVDYRTVLPDGTIKYLHAIGHPVFNAAGDLVEYMGTVMDVTERKRAEEALRASEQVARGQVEAL